MDDKDQDYYRCEMIESIRMVKRERTDFLGLALGRLYGDEN